MGIVGELGAGKTLTLTYLGLRNYIKYQGTRTIFANYHLKQVPYTYVPNPEDIDEIRSGIFLIDELWLYCDSRLSSSGRNKFVTKVLLKSRKRDLDILYTTQSLGQVDVRIRRISDFIAIPSFNEQTGKTIVRLYTHPSGYLLKVLKFDGRKIFPLYDTSEEISLPDEPEKKPKARTVA
jgi:hypothetical protein